MLKFINNEEHNDSSNIKIKILGIGGAGGNTLNSMIDSKLEGVEFIVANTDSQALKFAKTDNKIQLGAKSTKGLGSGANPDLGRRATEESIEQICEKLDGADIIFLIAGMGGGTGSGGISIIAKALKERNILTIAIATKPFIFEGKRRMIIAEEALNELKNSVDTLIIVPNQNLLNLVDRSVSMINAFSMINELIINSVKSISNIITKPGHINVDFADLRTIMKGMGIAMMGTGSASGENRAKEAAEKAISSELLENIDIKKAKGVLLNITGGTNLSLHEINDAVKVIYDESDKNANIILGSVIDPSLEDKVIVSVIATGFNQENSIEKNYYNNLSKNFAELKQQKEQNLKSVKEANLEKKELLENCNIEFKKPIEKKLLETKNLLELETLEIPAFLRKESIEKDKL